MKTIDDLILNYIKKEFKSVKEISETLKLPYVRVAVRLKQLRKSHQVICVLASATSYTRGVKPLKYMKKQ
jgi:predicted transcriptional regulator